MATNEEKKRGKTKETGTEQKKTRWYKLFHSEHILTEAHFQTVLFKKIKINRSDSINPVNPGIWNKKFNKPVDKILQKKSCFVEYHIWHQASLAHIICYSYRRIWSSYSEMEENNLNKNLNKNFVLNTKVLLSNKIVRNWIYWISSSSLNILLNNLFCVPQKVIETLKHGRGTLIMCVHSCAISILQWLWTWLIQSEFRFSIMIFV